MKINMNKVLWQIAIYIHYEKNIGAVQFKLRRK